MNYDKNPIKNKILEETKFKISIEADQAIVEKYVGDNGIAFGIDEFEKVHL